MTDYRSLEEALAHIIPNRKCPRCDSVQIILYGGFPTMDMNPPIYTKGVQCHVCGWNNVFSWQREINIGMIDDIQNED